MMDMITKSSSSEEVVLNQVDDLLTLILLSVPWKKLKVLKSPHFRSLLPPLRASGLIIQRHNNFGFPRRVYFVPLDNPKTPSPFEIQTFADDPFDPQHIRILQSCNGLLLCSTCDIVPPEKRNCFIYNPCTNQSAILPKYPPGTRVEYIGLAYDPSNSPHYKVIAFVFATQLDSTGDFHIYSSETGTWRVSVQSFSPPPEMYFDGGIYWNGCVHWLSKGHIKYDLASNVPDGLYFNVDEGTVKTFPKPPISVESTSERSLYFGESEDHLHFIEFCFHATSFIVYEMKSDYSEWFVKYQVDLAPISKVFPEMTEHEACLNGRNKYAVAMLSLIRRENFQEDSFLVLEIPGKVIRYNLVDRSFKVIWDFAAEFVLDSQEKINSWRFGKLNVSEYIETLS